MILTGVHQVTQIGVRQVLQIGDHLVHQVMTQIGVDEVQTVEDTEIN